MSWQSYIDDHLMADLEGCHLTASAIIGVDGSSVWAQSSSFPQGTLAPTGLHLGGTKYMVIQGEPGAAIRGKKMAYSSRIPELSKDNFDEWKIRMQVHLAARDDDMWYTITNGPLKIEKPRCEWTAEEKRLANLDNIAKDILFESLDKNTFDKIKMCPTAKEIWEKLLHIYEGNDLTKENKLYVAMQKFDKFKMIADESLNNFEDRFSTIMIELKALGKVYTNREVCLKVMRALPVDWDIKTMAMRASRDLNKLQLTDLFEDLKCYEFELNSRIGRESSSAIQHPKALVAAAQSTHEEPVEQSSSESMSLLSKKFARFLNNNHKRDSKRRVN